MDLLVTAGRTLGFSLAAGVNLYATVAILGLATRFGIVALHRLSRRWFVFVPAGIVLHDHLVVGEALLFPKNLVRSLGPAPADTNAVDATGRALGLVLELQLTETSSVMKRETDRLLFAPGRPGALLREARDRGLPVSPA